MMKLYRNARIEEIEVRSAGGSLTSRLKVSKSSKRCRYKAKNDADADATDY
jgi:hypothetical protein